MLPPWVSYRFVEDFAIFLDIRENRYSAMPEAAARAVVAGNVDKLHPAIAAQVIKRGWLNLREANTDRAALPKAPTLEVRSGVKVDALDARYKIAASVAIIGTHARLRVLTFEQLVHSVQQNYLRNSRASAACPLISAVSCFNGAGRLILPKDSCLLRSIALGRFLSNLGHRTTLIFGVKLRPFEAHCWLQMDDTVIGDTIEQVGMFLPILAVA